MGSLAALELGMRLVGVFDIVCDMILANVKGEAVSLHVAQRLEAVSDADKKRELPKIIAGAYKTLGRNRLGMKPFTQAQAQLQQKAQTDKDECLFFPKKNWRIKKHGQQQQKQGSRAGSPTPDSSYRTYDLLDRTKIKIPDRFQVPDQRSPRSF